MNKINKGFTMAEVLITIGIIGLVAALTIPHLTSHYRKTVTETRLARFYSVINTAITMSEVEHGPKEYWDVMGNAYDSEEASEGKLMPSEWFDIYLKKYIKYSHIQINDKTGKVMVYMPDGSLVLIGGASFQFWPDAGTFENYQTDAESGAIKNNMELSGVKYFTFLFAPYAKETKYHYKKGVEPYMHGWDGTVEMLKNNPSLGCQQIVSNERAYCAALIQHNGWKIPKDYPLKF